MRELFSIWRNTRMVALTAISAAAFVAVLVPFKGFVLIPGLTEIRPGQALPIVFSFLFGPAAAWGTALGNLMADVLGGTLGPASPFGFLGNFLYGYLPYAMWRAVMGKADPVRSGVTGWLVFGLILVTSNLMIGSVIGCGVDLLGLAPFAALGTIIAVNNLLASAAIAPILLALLYRRMEQWGLLYHSILGDSDDEEPGSGPDRPAPRRARRSKVALLGVALCTVGSAAAFATGLAVSMAPMGSGFVLAGSMAPGIALVLLGSALL